MSFAVLSLSVLLLQGLRDEAYYSAIRHSLDPLYRLDHDLALERLSDLAERFPEHPGPPLARAATLWLRELFRRQELEDLDRFISPGYFTKPADREMPENERSEIERLLAESEELARGILEAHPGHKDARYYLGSIEGIRGSYALTIGRSKIDALRHGKKAYQYHKAVVEEDPEYYDAYMTVGTYEYILDNLPWYVKWMAIIAGYTGDEKLGLEYLVRAADQGRFVAIDARVLLMVLYVREKDYRHGLQLARDLHGLFPENFLFHLNRGQILEKMDRRDEALDVYLEIERMAAERKPNYGKLPLGRFRLSLGDALRNASRHEEALERFELAASDSDLPHQERALARHEADEIRDLLGRSGP
ncbi:MAG: tetratricopeptide repeat protein [Vicinamibacteria bacterium]